MILLALALAQAASAAPSTEAQALGARVARGGSIMALLPLLARRDTEELISAHPDWSDADRVALRATADAALRRNIARIEQAFGTAYAKRLPIADLRALVAQVESPEAVRLRAIQPDAMAEAIAALGALDLKKEVAADLCRNTGKLCPSAEKR